ncbi:MAG: helix-turn-helix domain-containing protein [Cyanobacteria bacterium P01_D01_bin.56]
MTSYSTVQKQQLSQLGAYLQEKRQEQGKSLEDISLQTYIRAQLLKAVESGDTTDLPQPIFVQGFIRRYADALGLDGSNFAKQFPVHSIPNTPRPTPRPATQIDMPIGRQNPTGSPSPQSQSGKPSDKPLVGALPVQTDPPVVPIKKNVQPPRTAPANASLAAGSLNSRAANERELAVAGLGSSNLGDGINVPGMKASSIPTATSSLPDAVPPSEGNIGRDTTYDRYGDSSSWMDWWPWGVGAAVLVGAIALIAPRFMGNGTDQPTEPIQAEAPETEVVQAETPPPEPVPEPEPEPAVSSAPVSVQVEVTEAGPSWMSVNVDGEIVFEGLLDPGTQETWEAQSVITMNVGNAGAALISANGSEPAPAGNPGGAEVLTFTAEEE